MASKTSPSFVRSTFRKGHSLSAGGTMSRLRTSYLCSTRSRTTALPAFPLPPVTMIRVMLMTGLCLLSEYCLDDAGKSGDVQRFFHDCQCSLAKELLGGAVTRIAGGDDDAHG